MLTVFMLSKIQIIPKQPQELLFLGYKRFYRNILKWNIKYVSSVYVMLL